MSEPIEVYCTNANSERGPDLLFLPHVTHIPIFRQQWEKNKSDLYSTTSTLVTTVYDNLHRTSSAYVPSPWMYVNESPFCLKEEFLLADQ